MSALVTGLDRSRWDALLDHLPQRGKRSTWCAGPTRTLLSDSEREDSESQAEAEGDRVALSSYWQTGMGADEDAVRFGTLTSGDMRKQTAVLLFWSAEESVDDRSQ